MTDKGRLRLILLSSMVALVAAAVGARLWQLQVHHNERFARRAERQHQSRLTVQAVRGAILDREGRELAVSLKTESFYAHPHRIADPEALAAKLAPVLGTRERTLLKRLRSDKPFVYLERFFDPRTAAAVRELVHDEHGLGFETEPKRIYPRGKLGVHVLGFATIDGDGVEGVELEFDEILSGDPTVYLVQQDARHGRLRQLIRAPERRPRDVVLTIDLVLQHLAERELDRAMRETGAHAATALLMNPSTGQVLALANRPAADLNRYAEATTEQRINRALVHFYEPGSTFKFVPMSAALEAGKIGNHQRVFCENGYYNTGKRVIHDVVPHGMLTPRQILEKSSNIGMVKIVSRLKERELYETIRNFGFGARTGIELPGESPGRIAGIESWSGFTRASLSFGQEIGVTALQMCSAMAAVANDGVLVPPRVVLGTRDHDDSFQGFDAPKPRRVVSSRTATAVREMLESVVATGTGTRASLQRYRLAGKSGTAQKAMPGGGYSETEYIASFGGFGPLSDPQLAALVVLDSPRGGRHQGGAVAAPVFGRIMDEALTYLHVPGDADPRHDPHLRQASVETKTAGPPAANRSTVAAGTPGRVPDVRGMSLRRAAATLAAHGFHARVEGHGVVTRQQPGPGSPLATGQTCLLRLAERSGGRRAGGKTTG